MESRSGGDEKWIEEVSIQTFTETGLLLFVNSFLHIFGFAIVVEKKDGEFMRMYPARCRYRGFSQKVTAEAHKKLAAYIQTTNAAFTDDAWK